MANATVTITIIVKNTCSMFALRLLHEIIQRQRTGSGLRKADATDDNVSSTAAGQDTVGPPIFLSPRSGQPRIGQAKGLVASALLKKALTTSRSPSLLEQQFLGSRASSQRVGRPNI